MIEWFCTEKVIYIENKIVFNREIYPKTHLAEVLLQHDLGNEAATLPLAKVAFDGVW